VLFLLNNYDYLEIIRSSQTFGKPYIYLCIYLFYAGLFLDAVRQPVETPVSFGGAGQSVLLPFGPPG